MAPIGQLGELYRLLLHIAGDTHYCCMATQDKSDTLIPTGGTIGCSRALAQHDDILSVDRSVELLVVDVEGAVNRDSKAEKAKACTQPSGVLS